MTKIERGKSFQARVAERKPTATSAETITAEATAVASRAPA